MSSQFMEDLQHWVDTDRKLALRLLELMNECLRTPDSGKGKPERLKQNWAGGTPGGVRPSGAATTIPSDEFVEFAQARFHYDQ